MYLGHFKNSNVTRYIGDYYVNIQEWHLKLYGPNHIEKV